MWLSLNACDAAARFFKYCTIQSQLNASYVDIIRSEKWQNMLTRRVKTKGRKYHDHTLQSKELQKQYENAGKGGDLEAGKGITLPEFLRKE